MGCSSGVVTDRQLLRDLLDQDGSQLLVVFGYRCSRPDHDALGFDDMHNLMTGGTYLNGGDAGIYVINDYPDSHYSDANGATH